MFSHFHHITLSFIPTTLPAATVSTALFLFAAAQPAAGHYTSAEEVTFSFFKVVGIISAVAIGSWTTSRKLKSIEDAIAATITTAAILKVQINSMQKTMKTLACYNAPYCKRRKGSSGRIRAKRKTSK